MVAKIRLYQFNYRFNTDLTILLQNGKMKEKFGLIQPVLYHFKLTSKCKKSTNSDRLFTCCLCIL